MVSDEHCRSIDTIESLLSTSEYVKDKRKDFVVKLSDIEKQPDQVAKVLKRFLVGDWDLDHEGDDFLLDKVLLDFPVFSLNDDYLRALTNVIFMKLESVQNLLNHKNAEIQALVQKRDKRIRDRSLSLLKSKINGDIIHIERSMSPGGVS